jgi:hypothetical protein
MKKLLSITLIIIFIAGMLTTCKKDNGTAPSLPPTESLNIDFSNFTSLKKGSAASFDQKGTNNSAWDFAATIATAWKLIISTTLAVPVSAFKLAVDQDPVFLSNKTWEWSYSVYSVGVTYKARLTGEIGATDVIWKMYVTREGTGGFPEFVWFEGTSKLDGTGGQWIFNQSSTVPEKILQIDWTKSGTSIGSVTYTYVKNLDTNKGGYIQYGSLTSPTYNAFYKIHYYNAEKSSFSDVDVQWDTSKKNGRIKSSDFQGGLWFCWDENKINNTVNCPQ